MVINEQVVLKFDPNYVDDIYRDLALTKAGMGHP